MVTTNTLNLTISRSMPSRTSPLNLEPSSYPSTIPCKHSKFSNLSNVSTRINVSRRMLVPSVSGIWDAITGGNSNNAHDAVVAVRRGMSLFRQGDVPGSLAEFDRAIELDPRQKAYSWQRGLSLYYLDRFEEGAEQFRIDVAQNPNDTEESIWCFLCEAQLYGIDEARKRFLQVGRDSRAVMREAYNMFRDGGDPEKLVETFSSSLGAEYFYATLYAGLYYESLGESDSAKKYILASCQSPYCQRSDDYMASLAKVHCLCRNWDIPQNST
ncbi:hypothetical protein vseg_021490 [Gypsophila vaccaria]